MAARSGAAEVRVLLLLCFAALEGAAGSEPSLKCEELRMGQYMCDEPKIDNSTQEPMNCTNHTAYVQCLPAPNITCKDHLGVEKVFTGHEVGFYKPIECRNVPVIASVAEREEHAFGLKTPVKHNCEKKELHKHVLDKVPKLVKNGSKKLPVRRGSKFWYRERYVFSCLINVKFTSAGIGVTGGLVAASLQLLARKVPIRTNLKKNGYSYKVAVALSLFLGWLGADRFYLGYPALGLLKFCTVGFCGIGSLIDFILISMQIVGPSDGSSYIIDYYGARLTRLTITNATFRKMQTYP